jgi:hypothetical protein
MHALTHVLPCGDACFYVMNLGNRNHQKRYQEGINKLNSRLFKQHDSVCQFSFFSFCLQF